MTRLEQLPDGVRLAAALLDLTPPIEEDRVQQAFRQAALKDHPDHGGTDRGFRALVAARDMLLDFARNPKRPPERESPPWHAHPPPNYRANRANDVPLGWRRSRKGNLFRKMGGHFVTVFETDEGFKWVCEGQFSEWAYADERDACSAAEAGWL